MKKVFLILSILFCLTGCSSVKEHTVSFWNGDTLLSQQTISADALPGDFIPEAPEGMQFAGWEEPFTVERTDYHALFAPRLNQHAAYLFPDEDGYLRPDGLLTADMLRDALYALADPAAKKYLPALPSDSEPLSAESATEILNTLFPGKTISLTPPLTRAAFATEMNTLLDRRYEVIQPLTGGFPDMHPENPDYPELVEAAVEHEDGFIRTKDVLLDTGWSKGWHLIDGKLYLTDQYCCLVINDSVDGFQFDENGCYTSGNTELDDLVTVLLASFQEEAPEADRMELLQMAYEYCRDKLMYLNREAYPVGADGWQIDDAIAMLSTGKGNCYKYSAAFWALARGLGYDAMAVSGMINVHPHAWVIVYQDGNYFYCDPELEMSHRAENKYDWDLFMKERSTMKNWDYGEPEGLINDPPPVDPRRK